MYKNLDVQNYKVRKIMACFSTNNIQMVIFNIFVSIVILYYLAQYIIALLLILKRNP